jgi:quinol monooxygenase YgiN
MDIMIHVIAVITAKPGQREALLAQFHANIPAVRAENGCIEYGVACDLEPVLKFQTAYGPDTVVVVEKWHSLDALKAHGAAPHMVTFGAKTKELVASRAIHILQPAG